MVDIVALRSEIEDVGVTKTLLAKKCGFSRTTLDNKLDNPDTISVKDAYCMCQALRITDANKICSIFFAHDAHKS